MHRVSVTASIWINDHAGKYTFKVLILIRLIIMLGHVLCNHLRAWGRRMNFHARRVTLPAITPLCLQKRVGILHGFELEVYILTYNLILDNWRNYILMQFLSSLLMHILAVLFLDFFYIG